MWHKLGSGIFSIESPPTQGCTPCVLDIYEQELKSWKRTCEQIESGLDQGGGAPRGRMTPESYVGCVLREIRHETPACATFKFDLPRGHVLEARPGQHLVLKVQR